MTWPAARYSPKPLEIRHADELKPHQRLGRLQRIGNDALERGRIGAVGDHEILAIDEAVAAPAGKTGW